MPILVSVYASMNATLEYTQLGQQLRQTNSALTVLKSQKLWWESLSMVQRRLEENKHQLVSLVETAICTEDVTFTTAARKINHRRPAGKKRRTRASDADKESGSEEE